MRGDHRQHRIRRLSPLAEMNDDQNLTTLSSRLLSSSKVMSLAISLEQRRTAMRRWAPSLLWTAPGSVVAEVLLLDASDKCFPGPFSAASTSAAAAAAASTATASRRRLLDFTRPSELPRDFTQRDLIEWSRTRGDRNNAALPTPSISSPSSSLSSPPLSLQLLPLKTSLRVDRSSSLSSSRHSGSDDARDSMSNKAAVTTTCAAADDEAGGWEGRPGWEDRARWWFWFSALFTTHLPPDYATVLRVDLGCALSPTAFSSSLSSSSSTTSSSAFPRAVSGAPVVATRERRSSSSSSSGSSRKGSSKRGSRVGGGGDADDSKAPRLAHVLATLAHLSPPSSPISPSSLLLPSGGAWLYDARALALGDKDGKDEDEAGGARGRRLLGVLRRAVDESSCVWRGDVRWSDEALWAAARQVLGWG